MKVGGGGGGVPLAIRHQTRGIDQPPWLQACIHTCTYMYTHMHTHANIHIHTHSHTQCTHINTHAHVCMCIIHVCMCMHTCTHTFTHTQKYCWTANSLREKCTFCNWNYSKVLYSFPHIWTTLYLRHPEYLQCTLAICVLVIVRHVDYYPQL